MPERVPEAPVDRLFLERTSTRAFSPAPIPREALATLFEAARWAPSAMNDQPWIFLFADAPADLDRFRDLLAPANRRWADAAPVLAFVAARRTYRHDGKPNPWAEFDAGAAWMSLALQARMLGLHTHPMGGFDRERAPDVLGLPPDAWRVLIAIAIGYRGDPALLPEDIRARETPTPRKPSAEVYRAG